MTAISSIYDAIEDSLTALYPDPTYKKLDRPDLIEENSALSLNRGWGFQVSAGTNTKRKIGCKLSIEREFIITNTIVQRGTARDITIKESAEKTLLEDQFKVIKEFETNPKIAESVSAYVGKFEFQGDNGIELIFDGKTNFIMIRSSFIMEYFEDLNS